MDCTVKFAKFPLSRQEKSHILKPLHTYTENSSDDIYTILQEKHAAVSHDPAKAFFDTSECKKEKWFAEEKVRTETDKKYF